MASSRPAAGGGRWVWVDPVRLPRWVERFQERHGELSVAPAEGPPAGEGEATTGRLRLTAADGTVAELYPAPGATGGADLPAFLADARAPRRLGLLLARRGAAALGIAQGERLVTSKVDSWYVQSRTAAGGQSQQRYARRRANQAAAAAGKAADLAARLLLPAAADMTVLGTGGDRRTVEEILSDPRLRPLGALRARRHLPVPTPNLAVLREAVSAARAVAVHLPPPGSGAGEGRHERRDGVGS